MQSPLSEAQLLDYRRRLVDLLLAAKESVQTAEEESFERSGAERFQPDDDAVEEAALESEIDVVAAQVELREQVRTALERIDEGTYGTCANCERPIAPARLDVAPFAIECIDCARKREAESNEPPPVRPRAR